MVSLDLNGFLQILMVFLCIWFLIDVNGFPMDLFNSFPVDCIGFHISFNGFPMDFDGFPSDFYGALHFKVQGSAVQCIALPCMAVVPMVIL